MYGVLATHNSLRSPCSVLRNVNLVQMYRTHFVDVHVPPCLLESVCASYVYAHADVFARARECNYDVAEIKVKSETDHL